MSPVDHKRVFDGLIANGLRHLSRGLKGFESGDLDFAVTDAFFGIEIVLKALVFHRRWDFIFTDPESADAGKLMRGECRTIGRDAAIKRLRELGFTLPKSVAHFTILENHRNKLVHYFHPDFGSEKQRRRIASELANAWGALRSLKDLAVFSDAIEPHATAFGELDGRLLVLDNYLDQQAANIKREHAHPDWLGECPACHRDTFDGDCSLCGYSEPSHREIKHGAEVIGPASCIKCGALDSVVVSGDAARCTVPDCGAWFGGIHRCEFCQEFFVVSDESEVIDDEDHIGVGSYQFGCENCDGNLGYQMSKDD
jgi:hypothetical protein